MGCDAMRSVMCIMESLPLSRERSTQAPCAPLRANAVRNSLPRPRPAPVTTQVLPSREKEGRVMRLRRWREVAVELRRCLLLSSFRRAMARVDMVR